jgi:hypothetical protein
MFICGNFLDKKREPSSLLAKPGMSRSVTFTEPAPFLEQPITQTVATEAGFAWRSRARASEFQSPDDLPGDESVQTGDVRLNPSELIISEAPFLNESESDDAIEALVADQVFESKDWPSRYLNRDLPVADGDVLRFDLPALIQAGIMFGWAIEQAARIASRLRASAGEGRRIEIILESPGAVTPHEHLFVGLELQRRGIRTFDLILPWGGRWESAVDWIGDAEILDADLAVHRAIAEQYGWRMSFDHVEQKLEVLPLLQSRCGDALHLNLDGLGWIEATRILARRIPALLRSLLAQAQDRFAFDKPNVELATTEDDIRMLPDVPDSELERVFVDDFRGRQLLRFTAPSLLSHETCGPAIGEAIERDRQLHAQLVEAEARRHFAPWLTAAVSPTA